MSSVSGSTKQKTLFLMRLDSNACVRGMLHTRTNRCKQKALKFKKQNKSKLSSKLPDGTWDSGHWRESVVTEICKFWIEHSVGLWSIAFSGSFLQLFCHQISVGGLNQFMEFETEQPANTFGVQTYMENSTVALACFDVLIVTTDCLLSSRGQYRYSWRSLPNIAL